MRVHIRVPEKDVAGDRPRVEIHPNLLVVRARTPAAWEQTALKYLGLSVPAGLSWPPAPLLGRSDLPEALGAHEAVANADRRG